MARTERTFDERLIAERTVSNGTGQTLKATKLNCGVPRRSRRCYVVRLGIDHADHDIAKGGACIFAVNQSRTIDDALNAALACWRDHAND